VVAKGFYIQSSFYSCIIYKLIYKDMFCHRNIDMMRDFDNFHTILSVRAPVAIVQFLSRRRGLGGPNCPLGHPLAGHHHGPQRAPARCQGRENPGTAHLLVGREPARVLHPLQILELDSHVLDVELEQVPEGRQVLRGGLGVCRWVLGGSGVQVAAVMVVVKEVVVGLGVMRGTMRRR